VTIEKGELATSVKEKKRKNEIHWFDHAWNDKLLNQLLLSLGCWLMLARNFCVFNAGLKVDAAREIFTVIITSNDKNVHSCKRHTVVRRAFSFWQSLCPYLASRLTTVSLDVEEIMSRNVYKCKLIWERAQNITTNKLLTLLPFFDNSDSSRSMLIKYWLTSWP